MNEVADRSPAEAEQLAKLQRILATLRQSVPAADLVALHRADALLRHASNCRPSLSRRLLHQAEQVLHSVQGRARGRAAAEANSAEIESARSSDTATLAQLVALLNQRRARGAAAEPATFEAVLRRQEVDALRQVDDEAAVADLDALAPVTELKALQAFREEWARRSTEKAVAKALAQDKQVLILLPEIALSNVFLDRFKARFGCAPCLWHSGLTPAQRRRNWRGIVTGESKVVIGARSALFLPFADLGLMVIDEEWYVSFTRMPTTMIRPNIVRRLSVTSAHAMTASVPRREMIRPSATQKETRQFRRRTSTRKTRTPP